MLKQAYWKTFESFAIICFFALGSSACNTDDWGLDGSNPTSDGGEEGEDDEVDDEVGVDDTAGEDSTGEVADGGGEGGGVPCGYSGMLGGEYDVYIPPRDEADVNYRRFEPEEFGDCDFDGLFDETAQDDMALAPGHDFEVFVYHPQDELSDISPEDGWPDDLYGRPAVFFGPGNGYDLVEREFPNADETDHYYRELIQALVADGFVVFGINPDVVSLSSGRRRAAMACAMIWAREEWEFRDRLSEFMVLAGHSRSGGGAYLLTENLAEQINLPANEPGIDEWQQCALMTYAQSYGVDPGDTTIVPIVRDSSPPFLSMLGTIDGDTNTEGIRAFDNRYAESSSGTVDVWDEIVAVVHGQIHRDWGGEVGAGGSSSEGPFGAFYSRHFLRWQMMGEDASRRRFMDLIDVGVDSCAFNDLPFAAPAEWGGVLAPYYSGCTEEPYPDACCTPFPEPPAECEVPNVPLVGVGRPLIFANFGQGTSAIGAVRDPVDTLNQNVNGCAIWTGGQSGPGYFEALIGTSSSGGNVTARIAEEPESGTEGPCVCVSTPSLLNALDSTIAPGIPHACYPANDFFGSPDFDAHDGNVMLVHFGGSLGPVSIRWSLEDDGLGRDLSDYTHISVRIANVVTDADGSCASDWVPDEFTVNAYLEDGDGNGPHAVSLGVQVESDERVGGVGSVCRSAQFMHTLRIPLASVCAEGSVSIADARAILLEFPDDGQSHVAFVDSIELVRDPDGAALWPAYESIECVDPPTPEPCSTEPASAWNCIADELVATQTSCSGEPLSGECDILDIEEDPVALPEVEIPNGTFDGWVVHIPKGWIRDPQNPTQGELDSIHERCVAACELEYMDDPFVSANCSDSAAFLEPTLRNIDDIGAVVSVPDAHSHGEGLFVSESVACDLRSDCSAAFDENLGPSRLRRPTSQSEPLYRGEEWLVSVTGDMEAGSSYAAMSLFSDTSAAMGGTVGYSRCAPGNAPETCPFYLGSMDLELLEPLTLDLECDSVLVSHELTELTLRLAQPAFGISEDGTTYNGFTPGGLVIEAEGVVDEIPFTSRRPIEQPVYVDAADGLLTMQGELDGFVLEFEVPCNGLMADVAVGWSLVEDAVLEGPPTLGIGHLPATMTCPDDLPLTLAWASDPDSDYDTLQWIVDGVLLDGEYPTLSMTASHEITAVLRDSRGATGSATTVVACE